MNKNLSKATWYLKKWPLLKYFTLDRFLFTEDVARKSRSAKYTFFQYQIKLIKFFQILKTYQWRNSFLIRLWPTVCNFTKKQTPSQTFSMTSLKLLQRLFPRASLSLLLLSLDKNNRYYKHCIKQTTPKQLLILVNDSDLQKLTWNYEVYNSHRANVYSSWNPLPYLSNSVKLHMHPYAKNVWVNI